MVQPAALYDWQMDAIAAIGEPPDDRRILWYYDPDGSTGKTALCKYLIAKKGAFYLTSAKGADMTYQVIKARGDPKLVVVNLTRQAEGAFSYASLESIKDGLVFSGKYEGGTRIFNPPHILVFSNWYPDLEKLTRDRWTIITLRNNPPRVVLRDILQ